MRERNIRNIRLKRLKIKPPEQSRQSEVHFRTREA